MPTRIPNALLHGWYAAHCGPTIQRLRVPPPIFCEALALALEIPPADFQLGRTRLFFRAGAGEILEQLTSSQDSRELVARLMDKSEVIQRWAAQRQAQLQLQAAARRWLAAHRLRCYRRAAARLQHAQRSRLIRNEHAQRHALWAAQRERERERARAAEAA